MDLQPLNTNAAKTTSQCYRQDMKKNVYKLQKRLYFRKYIDASFFPFCLLVSDWAGACEQMNPLIDEQLQEIDRCCFVNFHKTWKPDFAYTMIYNLLFCVTGTTQSCRIWIWKLWRPWSFTISSWTKLLTMLRTPRCSHSTDQPAPLCLCRSEQFSSIQFLHFFVKSCCRYWVNLIY